MTKPLRVSILGLGRFGKLRHRLLAERGDVDVVGYFDPHVPAHAGLDRVASADAILDDRSLDAVVIATPGKLSKDLVLRAIERGKHVLCEKPPGTSLADARAMHAAALARPELVVKFGFNHRFMSHYQRLRDLLHTGEYGKPLWVRGLYGKGFDRQFFEGWRSDGNLAGGGILMDQGVHLLDLVMHALGDVRVEHAMVDSIKQSAVEDNVFVLLRSHAGIPISLCSSILQWKHTLRLEVGTEDALIVLEGIKSSTRSFGDEILSIHAKWQNNFVETHTSARNDPDFYTLMKEHDEFLGAIRGGPPIVHGTTRDAVALMQVVSDIYAYKKPRKATDA